MQNTGIKWEFGNSANLSIREKFVQEESKTDNFK